MVLASLLIAILSIGVAIGVSFLAHRRNAKALRRIEAMQIAGKSKDEVRTIERLLEDIERTHEKRGLVVQREDGKWSIDWSIDLFEGSVPLSVNLGLCVLRVVDRLRCKRRHS